MTLTRNTHPDLQTPGFRKVFYDRYKVKNDLIDKVFYKITADKAYVKDTSIGAFGLPTELDGSIDYGSPKQGYDITVNFPEYAGGFIVTRRAKDDDEYRVINKLPAGLGKSMAIKRQIDATSFFSEAFTYEPSDLDACEMCASDHPSPVSGISTQSNEGTTSLSPAALTATRILMMKFYNDQGIRIGITPNALVVPVDLQDTALEITKSANIAFEMSNTKNVNDDRRWQIIVMDHATDSNDWFMLDLDYAKGGEDAMFIWVDRIKAEFGKDMSSDTFQSKYYSYARYNKYWNDFRCIYGHKVS